MLYLIILVVGAIFSLIGPWWSVAVVACVACAFKARTSRQAWFVSAVAGVTLWVGYSLILVFSGKENLVAKIGAIFTGGSAVMATVPSLALILVIVSLVAGLTTGFSGLAGKHIRNLFA